MHRVNISTKNSIITWQMVALQLVKQICEKNQCTPKKGNKKKCSRLGEKKQSCLKTIVLLLYSLNLQQRRMYVSPAHVIDEIILFL